MGFGLVQQYERSLLNRLDQPRDRQEHNFVAGTQVAEELPCNRLKRVVIQLGCGQVRNVGFPKDRVCGQHLESPSPANKTGAASAK
jgi:hypothetical protein